MAKRDVMKAIGTRRHAVSALEIQNATGLSQTTVQTTLRSLVQQRLAVRSWDGARYLYVLTDRGVDRLYFWDRRDEERDRLEKEQGGW